MKLIVNDPNKAVRGKNKKNTGVEKRKKIIKRRALLLILIAIVIIFGIAEIQKLIKNSLENNGQVVAENVPNDSKVKEEEVIPEDITINMSVIGDIMCHNSNYNDAYNSDTDTYDFSYVFQDIAKYFENDDITIGNLETTLAGKEIGYSSYPTFNTPEILATDLKELGLDVLATANNHSLDKGYVGIENTITELDNVGISHTGTYNSQESSEQYLVKDVNGINIAFLNYTYGTNGIAIPSGREYCVNLIDRDKIQSDLNNVKALGNVDLICVIIHWGTEYRLTPTDEQEELANFMFENGADIILGGHSHCLEPMEKRTITLEDGTTKDGFIVYSLGNFMSGQNKSYTRQSVILQLQITKNGETGAITIDKIEYVPIYMYNYSSPKGAHNYKILDIESEIAKYEAGDTSIGSSLYSTLKTELGQVEEILGPEIINATETVQEENLQ